ncbi:PD-(D/E)XK motif protein [bacterium]|nr:PD-(D/E)XK motif protein [bacterium]
MKLYDIFKNLNPLTNKVKDCYSARVIEGTLHRIGVNDQNHLTLLIKTTDAAQLEPRSFTNLDIRHSVECLIEKDTGFKEEERGIFSIIIFKNTDNELVQRFLELISLILDDLKSDITTNDIERFLKEIIEIFKPQERISNTTLIGLIGELITIYMADDKDKIIDAWHTKNSENFDFYSSGTALEIKTTNKNTRNHRFKINQLTSSNIKIFVGSVLIKEKIEGSNLEMIYETIRKGISNRENEKKLMTNIFKIITTNSVNEFKIDLDYSLNSYAIYDSNIVPKITDAPLGVTEVKFNSDLSSIEKSKITVNNIFN